ncbi:MAG: hypothetical protein A3C50_03665 [Candidatus Staskawiczbacteria bacterium RIFCSPHIGHO2_02_FULL_43_16]|nr:MAG: hypothetical protein A3C50_03665 [Candidatus Staskawiczbacteria bacterium RIFCSPHIGHO2_02_FULL_43_16]
MGFGSEELFTIQSSIVKEGSRALKSSGNFPQIAVGIHKNGVLVPTGRIKYYFRADEGAPYSGFRLLENSSVKVEVIFNIGAHTVHYRNNSSQNIIMGSFNADTWYSMVIEWRDSDKKVRYRFNEGDFTPWVSPISPWASGLHRITLYRNVGGATSHVYYDDIQDPITNNSKTPALIVPGLMGTEMKNGNELLWADIIRMVNPLDADSFMDPLAFSKDLIPSNANVFGADIIKNPSNLFDYSQELINEFESHGYVENQNLFTFPYDWRYGVTGKYLDGKTNVDLLEQKVADILVQTGADKVDVIAHSMGGLIVKKYVVDNIASHHIGKSIFVGVPSTGAPKSVKVLLQGDNFGVLGLNDAEMKKISANLPAAYDLLPSQKYYDVKGSFVKVIDQGDLLNLLDTTETNLNYSQFGNFITNDHGLNAQGLTNAGSLHTQAFDDFDMRTAGVDLYAIDGCKAGTIGTIIENRQKSIFGQNLVDYKTPKFIPGDGTVPLESATNLPIDTAKKFYALKGEHSKMMSQDGTRQQIVNLLAGSSLGVDGNIITQNIDECKLNGKAISVFSPIDIFATDQDGNKLGLAQDGSIFNEIPNAAFEIMGKHKFLYLPTDGGQVYDISIQGTGEGTYTIGSQDIVDGQVVGADIFSNLPVTADLTGTVNLGGGQTTLTVQENSESAPETILPSAIVVGDAALDVLPPVSVATLSGIAGQEGFYRSDVSVEINATDENSGVLALHYKIDGGAWQSAAAAAAALTFTTAGEHIITFFATDNAGNNKQQQTLNFTIDKTAPEAVIEFDPVGKDLKFSAQNDPGAVVVDNDNVITLADQAGNVTQITLKNKNRKITRTARIDLLTYNGALADIGSNMMVHAWMADKNGELSTLVQQIIFKDDFHIQTIFNGKTTMVVGKDSSGRIYETFSGLKMIKISTNKGGFGWSY